MSEDRQGLKPNAIAFIALCNEYCAAVEHAAETGRDEFLAAMLRLLPRLYISGADLAMPGFEGDYYIDDALDEDFFNLLETVRDAPAELIESALGAVREDFGNYWSQKLCNVLRALNQIRYK